MCGLRACTPRPPARPAPQPHNDLRYVTTYINQGPSTVACHTFQRKFSRRYPSNPQQPAADVAFMDPLAMAMAGVDEVPDAATGQGAVDPVLKMEFRKLTSHLVKYIERAHNLTLAGAQRGSAASAGDPGSGSGRGGVGRGMGRGWGHGRIERQTRTARVRAGDSGLDAGAYLGRYTRWSPAVGWPRGSASSGIRPLALATSAPALGCGPCAQAWCANGSGTALAGSTC